MFNEGNFSISKEPVIEKRRTIRIKRAGLKKTGLESLDRPTVKFAETIDELEQAFSLVYRVYSEKGYIQEKKDHGMYFTIYSLLPDTVHIVAKSYLKVISNLTQIFDTTEFGLPMDSIYKKELDKIRNKNRSIVELSALATPREHRWRNIFLYQVQVMYWYSLYKGVDDICIAVNPRHVRFYMHLFPFEIIGEKKIYERVGAPAVALRGKVEEAIDVMMEIFNALDVETPLDYYFYFMTGTKPKKDSVIFNHDLEMVCPNPKKMDASIVSHFLKKEPSIIKDLTPPQKKALISFYPGLVI